MRSKRYQHGFIQFLPLIAAGIGAAASHINANKNNNANEAMSREQMQFNADEAEKNRAFSASQASELRDWQAGQASDQRSWSENMSATSYQRAVGDMSRAGLNPMLAYSQGGAPMPQASAPSGAMGSGSAASYSNIPQRHNAVQAGLASAAAAAQVANIDADTKLKEAQAAREVSSAGNLEANTKDILYKLQEKVPEEIRELRSRQGTQFWSQMVDAARTEVLKLEKQVVGEKINTQVAETEYVKIKTLLNKLAEPQARNAANAQDSWWMRNISPYLPDALKSGVLLDRAIR